MNNILTRSFFSCWLLLFVYKATACQCPLTSLGMAECDKYEIIFKGKVLSTVNCDHRLGEAIFEISELYKGDAAKKFKVLFKCNEPCAAQFNPGDEWIIYSRYKQVDAALMDWCSRSRKYFHNTNEDFYAVTYGNDYDDEVKFLRDKLGTHRFLHAADPTTIGQRNKIPAQGQMALLFIASLLGIVLFYWLFNKFFKF